MAVSPMFPQQSGGLQMLYSALDYQQRERLRKEAEAERQRQLEEQRRQQREANKHSAFGDTLKLVTTVGGAAIGSFTPVGPVGGAAIGSAVGDATMAFAPNVGGTQPGADNPYYTPTTDTQKALTAVNAGLQFYSAYEANKIAKERALATADAKARSAEKLRTTDFQTAQSYVTSGFDAQQGFEGLQGTEYEAMPSLARDLKESGKYSFLKDEDFLLIAAGEADNYYKFGPTLETMTLRGTNMLYEALAQPGATAQSVLADLDSGETAWAKDFKRLPVPAQTAAKADLMKQSRETLTAANAAQKEKAEGIAEVFNTRTDEAVKRAYERVDAILKAENPEGMLPTGFTLEDLQGTTWSSDPAKVKTLLQSSGTGDDFVLYKAMQNIVGKGRDTDILNTFPPDIQKAIVDKSKDLGLPILQAGVTEEASAKPPTEVGEGDLANQVETVNNSTLEKDLEYSDYMQKWDMGKQDAATPDNATVYSSEEAAKAANPTPTQEVKKPLIGSPEDVANTTLVEQSKILDEKAGSALQGRLGAKKLTVNELIDPVKDAVEGGMRGEYLGSYGKTPELSAKVKGKKGAIQSFAGSALETLSNATQLGNADEAPAETSINTDVRTKIDEQLGPKSVYEQLSERRRANVQEAGKLTTSPELRVIDQRVDDLKAQIQGDNETRAAQEQAASETPANNKSPLYEILDLQEEITTNLDSAAEKVRAAEEISRQLVTSSDTEKSTNYYRDVQTAKTELAQLANVVSRAEQANAGKQAKPLTEQKSVFQELNQQAQRLNANLDALLKGEPLPTTEAAPDPAEPAELPTTEAEPAELPTPEENLSQENKPPSAFEEQTLDERINQMIREEGKKSRAGGGISGVKTVRANIEAAKEASLSPERLAEAASWFQDKNFISAKNIEDDLSFLNFMLQDELNKLVMKSQYENLPERNSEEGIPGLEDHVARARYLLRQIEQLEQLQGVN